MEILALGIDHQHAGVALREKLAFGPDELRELHSRLRAHLLEAIVVSTCNRTELYALVSDTIADCDAAAQALCENRGISATEFSAHVIQYRRQEAVRHLFRVAVGLESIVVGEHQIMGQLRAAAELAAETKSAGPIMTRLFHDALAVGKRARVESGIARNSVSIATAAVELAHRALATLEERTVLVIGAGRMSGIAARSLAAKRVGRMVVVSRQSARAEALAARVGGEWSSFSDLGVALAEADVVITATAARGSVIDTSLARDALATRPDRPLILIDVAVPRDVDPSVSQLAGCTVYNVDDLAALRQANLATRRLEGLKVEAMIAEGMAKFEAWYVGREFGPTIARLVARAEQIRQREMDRVLARMETLSDRDRNLVNAMTQAIVNKLLHDPIVRLKERGGRHDARLYNHAVRELFALREDY